MSLPHVNLQDSPRAGQPVRWSDCDDLEVYDDDGVLQYAGPRYFRCERQECRHLVTHGMVRQGGCWCGGRKLIVPMRLTTEEKSLLKRGYYPLVQWEQEQIQAVAPEGKTLGWGKADYDKRYA